MRDAGRGTRDAEVSAFGEHSAMSPGLLDASRIPHPASRFPTPPSALYVIVYIFPVRRAVAGIVVPGAVCLRAVIILGYSLSTPTLEENGHD